MTDNTISSVPEGVPQQSVPQQTTEGLVPQSKVNDLIGQAKEKAREDGRREAEERLRNQSTAATQQSNAHANLDEARKVAAEEARAEYERNRKADQEAFAQRDRESKAMKMATDFEGKIVAAKDKYPDLNERISKLNLGHPRVGGVAILANDFDNTADIMSEIVKNPHKLGSFMQLLDGAPDEAREAMRELSLSLKENDSAKNVRYPNEPLSEIKHNPSLDGASNGVVGYGKYKRNPKYMG